MDSGEPVVTGGDLGRFGAVLYYYASNQEIGSGEPIVQS